MLTKKEKTTIFIFNEFKKKKVDYAIGRNYENFPYFKSDVDIFYYNNLQKIKKILVTAAKKYNWSFLVYDESKCKNFEKENGIDIFYFYDKRNNIFLQYDFFKSMLILSLPYFKFSKDNFIKIKNDIKVLPKNISASYNIFQISKLLKVKNKNFRKIKKYRKNFLKIRFNNIFKKKFPLEIFLLSKIRINLKKNNFIFFQIYIFFYKKLFFFNYLIKNPFQIYKFFLRIYEYYLLYFRQPTGLVLTIPFYYKDKIKLNLNSLKKSNLIDDWEYFQNIGYFRKYKYLERRNLILSLNKSNKKINIIDMVIKKLLSKNKVLFHRKNV